MQAFRANINDLQKVKIGQKAKPGQRGQPGSDKFKILSDEESDNEPSDGEGEPSDSQGEPSEGEGQGEGQESQPAPGSVPTINQGGKAVPIIDIIPDSTTVDEMFDSPEKLAGSDAAGDAMGRGSKPVMTREEMKKAIDQANKDQAMEIKNAGQGRGEGMGSKRIGVPGDFPTKTDWSTLLKNLLQKYQVGPPSYTQIHKRTFGMKLGGTPVMIPGSTKKKDIGKIIVAIDTSGSISDAIMNGFLSELKKIFITFADSKTFAVKVILWADGPYADSPDFTAKEFSKLASWTNSNFVSGGTSIEPVIKYINKNYNGKYIGVVWFTDGQVEDISTQLPDAFHFVLINGFVADLVKQFVIDMKRLKPRGKDVTFLRTDYQ